MGTKGGSNCPTDKVESVTQTDDDSLSRYESTILLDKCTNNYTSTIPTQNDIIDEMEGNTMYKINVEALYLRSVAL